MTKIAFIGGGPAALLLLQRALKTLQPCSITIFEADETLGRGMPYSAKGANKEHLTNVSSDEIAAMPESLVDWLRNLSDSQLRKFDLKRGEIDEKIVVPRLLLGDYLNDQFDNLIAGALAKGFKITVSTNTKVNRLTIHGNEVVVGVGDDVYRFDTAVVCTGHLWLVTAENEVAGYFDSPYPPSKLSKVFNHPVCIRGTSLTAIDAVATIARANGEFSRRGDKLHFSLNENSKKFRLEMFSRDGLLPSLRVHMDDPYPGQDALLSGNILREEMAKNDGFLPLDFMYSKVFLEPLKEDDSEFYETIKDLSIEQFVERMMEFRKNSDPFELLRSEYEQSLQSIRNEKPVPWKELLSALSVALNYPAKHLSAEDTIRLRKVLMPLIGVVIAYAPQQSAEELLALHDAGVLSITTVSDDASVVADSDHNIVYKLDEKTERKFQTFVDCVGQQNLNASEFPLSGLVKDGLGRQAVVQFRSESNGSEQAHKHPEKIRKEDGKYFLLVPGLDITDHFQLVDKNGDASDLIYLMAVPFIAGLNPDYSGLDFCDNASRLIVDHIHHGHESKAEQVSNRQAN